MTVLRSSNIQSWGRVINEDHFVYSPFRRKDAAASFDNARANGLTCIASGLRRSYGDTCLNPHNLIVNMCGIDRFMQFDAASGVLRAEAGTSLGEIMQAMVPRGYFLHTTPGTRFVTLGGAIANDVHGKNHHSAGSFGENVLGFGLLRSDHEHEIHVTAETEPELYRATIGGLGLTGIISWVDLQLVSIPSAMIRQEITPFDNLDDFFDVSKDALTRFEHTVAWVDCTATGDNLGRGIFTGGNWSRKGELKSHASGGPNVPFDAPGFALNPLTLKAFNTLYNWRQKSKRPFPACIIRLTSIHSTQFKTGTKSTAKTGFISISPLYQ
jgi:FAD/FMN-containing dehydrogenase